MTEVRIFDNPEALGAALAAEIVTRHERATGSFLLGCPGGRSLRSTYAALGERRPDFSRCTIVMMDEYVPVPPLSAHYSCTRVALQEVCAALGIPEQRLLVPDPADPSAHDGRIADAGGIDLFLLASGASDGHVAFLPPGSTLDGRTSVLRLADSTRRDNVRTFPEFASLDDVPEHGVSVGLATIRDSRSVRLVLHGADKREAVRRVRALDTFDPSWPASVVHVCPDGEIWIDRAAA